MKNKNDSVFKFNSMLQAALLSGECMVNNALTGIGLQPLPGAELTKADVVAGKKLFEVANTFGLKALQVHIDENPPNARTIAVLLLVAQVKAESSLVSRSARKRARSTRKVDGKDMALDLWRKWQSNPDRHKDKTAFCNHTIVQISLINKQPDIDIKTMNVWFDHFRLAETSPEWEAKFGKKYTEEKSAERAPTKTPIAMLLDFYHP